LTETSQNIFNFTNGRVQLKDITIQLPLSWQVDHCAPPSAIVSNFNEEPDVKISSSHPLLGDLPWTIQFAGCQQAGKNIELPYEFVGKNRTMAQKSSLLTKEWIKLRFGVFEEDGFDGDNLYPSSFVEGKSNMSNNACPDKHQVMTVVDPFARSFADDLLLLN
jgi:calcium-activated chloride channel regulator 4